ncbi:unnamed protein product [Closterium sp. NIES-54]
MHASQVHPFPVLKFGSTAKAPLDEVVMDVVGPLKLRAAGAEYFLAIVDVYTRMTWVYVLSKKSAVAETWLFKIKSEADGKFERYKSRLVVKGYEQKEKVDYKEMSAPMVKVTMVRTLLTGATIKGWVVKQMDVTTAFLNGILEEEIFLVQPEGFDDGSCRVLKLKKALHGLKQAPRQWYLKLRGVLEEIGFTPSTSNHSLFMLGEGEQRSFMVVYVDDILIFSPSSNLVTQVMLKLQDKFKCKALGDVTFYLGLHIEHDVEKRCMRCVKEPEEESVGEEERRRFHSLVGSLMYAAVNTQPDVAFATGQFARVIQCPNEEQVAAGMRVAKYLGQTPTVGLQYSAAVQRRQKGADGVEPGRLFLTAFSDASYASEPEDMTSVGGFICCVGVGPTAWESKKPVDQALSSADSEYMALFRAGRCEFLRERFHVLSGGEVEGGGFSSILQFRPRSPQRPVAAKLGGVPAGGTRVLGSVVGGGSGFGDAGAGDTSTAMPTPRTVQLRPPQERVKEESQPRQQVLLRPQQERVEEGLLPQQQVQLQLQQERVEEKSRPPQQVQLQPPQERVEEETHLEQEERQQGQVTPQQTPEELEQQQLRDLPDPAPARLVRGPLPSPPVPPVESLPSYLWTRRSPLSRAVSPEPRRSRYRADSPFHLVLRSRVPHPPVLPHPPESPLTVFPNLLSDYLCASYPVAPHVFSSLVTHPTAPPLSVSALITTLASFASSHLLDYASHLVSATARSPSTGGVPLFLLEVVTEFQDNPASERMTPGMDLLAELEPSQVKHVTSVLGQRAKVKGIGKAMFKGADGKMLGLKNVLWVRNLAANLISVQQLQKPGMDTSSKGAKTYTARLGERILWDLHEDRDVYNEMWQILVVPMLKERQVVASVSTKVEAVGSGDGANGRAKEIESKKCNLGRTSKLGEHEERGAESKKQHKGEENPKAAAEEENGESMWGTIASAALFSNPTSATGVCDWLTLHRRMGHVALPILQQLVKSEIIAGIRVKGGPDEVLGCPTSMQAKFTRFPLSISEATAEAPFDEVVMDVVGPFKLGADGAE